MRLRWGRERGVNKVKWLSKWSEDVNKWSKKVSKLNAFVHELSSVQFCMSSEKVK